MGTWTAILLAGQRPGEADFPAAHGVTAKALIRAGGEAMLGRVARTLLDCPSLDRLLVLAQAPEALTTGDLAWLGGQSRIAFARAGDGISASVASVISAGSVTYPVLVTTADHALLTPEMVESFLARTEGADAAFAVVERRTLERAYPETKRTWIKFSDGHFTGANLFALRTPAVGRGLEVWARAEKDRKKALKLLTFLGPMIFLRAFTRTISLDEATAKAGRSAGLTLRAVRLPFAEAAIDVDKEEDLALAERILAER